MASPAVCLVQDCIRHVALATNALAAVQVWGLMENPSALYMSLWKATATSFLVVESTGEPLNLLPAAVSESFCRTVFRLADLALHSLALKRTKIDPSSLPLATTFLRVFQHPLLVQDLLHSLSVPKMEPVASDKSDFRMLWSTMEQQIRTNADPDLKRVVQTAILTLASSGTSTSSNGHSSHSTVGDTENVEWQLAQALMDRLLPMFVNSDDGDDQHYTTRVSSPTGVAVAATPASNRNQNGTPTHRSRNQYQAWDALFVRQWEHIMMLQQTSASTSTRMQHPSQAASIAGGGTEAMAMDYDL
jgi:hypothetical protein